MFENVCVSLNDWLTHLLTHSLTHSYTSVLVNRRAKSSRDDAITAYFGGEKIIINIMRMNESIPLNVYVRLSIES